MTAAVKSRRHPHRPAPLLCSGLAGERTLSYDEHIKFVSLEVNAGSLSAHQAKLTLIMENNKHSNIITTKIFLNKVSNWNYFSQNNWKLNLLQGQYFVIHFKLTVNFTSSLQLLCKLQV